jgi:hypothetical protein
VKKRSKRLSFIFPRRKNSPDCAHKKIGSRSS